MVFINERRPKFSISFFRKRTKAGEKGLFIARKHPDDVALQKELSGVECYWLLLREGENCVRPSDLDTVESIITSFFERHKGGIALLDGIEILSLYNDFEEVLNLLRKAQLAADSCGGSIIIPVDNRAIYPEDLRQISAGFKFLDIEG